MRDHITTGFEVAGLLAVNAAGFVFVSAFSLAGALAAVGGLFLAESAVIVRRR